MAVDEPATTIFIVILEVFEIVFVMTGGRFETGVIANRQRDVPVPDLGLERPAGGIGLPRPRIPTAILTAQLNELGGQSW